MVGARCLRRMSRMSPPPLHHWSCPARRSQGWPVPGPIFRHTDISRYLDIYTTHTRKLVIKVFISWLLLHVVCPLSPYHLGLGWVPAIPGKDETCGGPWWRWRPGNITVPNINCAAPLPGVKTRRQETNQLSTDLVFLVAFTLASLACKRCL